MGNLAFGTNHAFWLMRLFMPTVMLVDDDQNFLLSFVEGLRSINKEFKIYTAKNGKLAVKILKTNPVDLIVTDLRMPIMDGFELISYLSRNHSQIPIIVITAFGMPEIENNIYTSAAFQYLEKPLDFNILVERINVGLQAKESGQLRGISILSFLQLVELEKKNFTLAIRSEKLLGFLYFKNGKLINAETAHFIGEEAALEIVGWDPAEIEIDQKNINREHKISVNLNSLIAESLRNKKEKNNKTAFLLEKKGGYDPDLEISYIDPMEARKILLEEVTDHKTKTHNKKAADKLAPEDAGGHKKNMPLSLNENNIFIEEDGDYEKSIAEIIKDNTIFHKETVSNEKIINIKKEKNMDVQKLHQAIESLKQNVGAGLLSTDIIAEIDGQTIAGYNSNPKAASLFSQITTYMVSTLKESGLPEIGRYYIVDLTDNKMVIVISMGDYSWIMLIDSLKSSLGLLLNISIPKAMAAFEEAIVG
jgi:DNA-binding response OmpR family regulator